MTQERDGMQTGVRTGGCECVNETGDRTGTSWRSDRPTSSAGKSLLGDNIV